MTACPTLEQLEQFLASALPNAEQAAAAEHIDGCAACQEVLERLTAAPPRIASTAFDPAAATFLARVQAIGPSPEVGPRPAAKRTPPPEIPGYEIAGELGRGGMGVVYQARHRRLNRLVALKMLTDAGLADPGIRSRFLIEAETIAQLRHPHIVQVYEFGESAGRPYLAMEYVDGGNLVEWLSCGRRFPPDRAAELVARIADAVAAAHAKGIIHRDLKPSNILLVAPDPAAGPEAPVVPKVADFGIARVGRSELTATGDLLGTPNYMAPEQASGRHRDIGTATDVHGLGTILYELLVGRPPFAGDEVLEVLQQVIHTTPRSPRSVLRNVPRDLDTICLKCLEKNPEKRYPTADALAADLRAYLAGRTIAARPAQPWEHAVRLARRNPIPAAALLVVGAIAVGAFVWVNEARREEAGARKIAETERTKAVGKEADAAEARRLAECSAARLAFEQAISLCEAGNESLGLAEFSRVLEAAVAADDRELVSVVVRARAVWDAYRPRVVRAFDPPDPARPVSAAVFADEGRVLVTGGRHGSLRVWPVRGELPDSKPFWDLPAPSAERPGVVAVFPGTGARLNAVYESGHVSEWNLTTGKAVRHDLAFDPAAPIRSATMTLPDRTVSGRLLAAGSADGTYRVWDMDQRALLTAPNGSPVLRHFYLGTKKRQRVAVGSAKEDFVLGAVTGVGFVDNGNMLLSAGEKEGIILLGLPLPKTGRLLNPIRDSQPVPGVPYHQFDLGGEVFRLLVAPNRQLFLAGGATAVSLWTIHDRERPLWVHGHPDEVTALAFSSDGRLCASADRSGTVRCRDVASGAFQAEIRFPGPVLALQFPPESLNVLLVGGRDGSSALWQLPIQPELTNREVEPTPAGPGVVIRIGSNPEQAVQAVGFDPVRRGEWAATSRKLLFWPNAGPGAFSVGPSGDGRLAPRGTAVSPDGEWAIFSVLGRDTLSLWRLGEKPIARRVPAAGVTHAGFVDRGSFFTVSAEADGTNRIRELMGWWELDGAGGATRRTVWPLAGVTCVAPHPDGQTLLIGRSGNQRNGFWELSTGREVGAAMHHPTPIAAVAVDPQRRWAATGGQDGSVRIWPLGPDGPAGQALERSPMHGGGVNGIAFGTGVSEGVLVTASSDGTARFWDAKTGYPLGPPLRHPEAVLSVAFDPTGEKVITGGRNGVAKVWPAPKSP